MKSHASRARVPGFRPVGLGAAIRVYAFRRVPISVTPVSLGVAIDAGKKVAETMAKAPELKPNGRPRADDGKGTKQVPLSKGGNNRLAARIKRNLYGNP